MHVRLVYQNKSNEICHTNGHPKIGINNGTNKENFRVEIWHANSKVVSLSLIFIVHQWK